MKPLSARSWALAASLVAVIGLLPSPSQAAPAIPVSTTTTLALSRTSDFAGSNVPLVLTATVAASPAVVNGLNVNFSVDGNSAGTGQTVGGVATLSFNVSALTTGTHTFHATFPTQDGSIGVQDYKWKASNTAQQQLSDLVYTVNEAEPADTTRPSTVVSFTGTPGSNGWYISFGNIELNATDDAGGSGVKEINWSLDGGATWTTVSGDSAIIPVNADGNYHLLYSALDNEGNIEGCTTKLWKCIRIKVDTTAPTITGAADRAPNANNWYNANVTVGFTVSDSLSGIDAATDPADVVLSAEAANQSASGTVSDLAGNTASTTVSGINIDKTAPSITGGPDRAPNGAGWYNADVTVSFSATDGVSGIDTVSGPATLGEAENQSVTGTATDLAGNSFSFTVSDIDIDKTKPVIDPLSNINQTATSTLGALVSFSTTGSDALSGLDSIGSNPASGSQFGLGTTMVTVTATDVAGNVQTATFTVSVTYGWSGFLQPINTDGSSVFKAGSTVPVKFQLTGSSASITNLQAKLSYAKVSNNVLGTVNEAASTTGATEGNLFRYDPTSGQYIFNWSTKGLTAGCYQLSVDFGDGVQRTVKVSLK